MSFKVWYLLASLFFVSVRGQTNDNGPRFYENRESSSPAPPSSPQPDQQLSGMKEVVLYLTGDQVKSLQAAGAIVKPFPQFEKAFLQQQYQQSVEEPTEAQPQPEAENKDPRQEELDEFYKVLNIQQINEDLGVQAQSGEPTTEKPRPKYKYSPKFRQQDYSAIYVQKKANRGKPSSTEYVRYLPNYEIEELKMQPYRPQPIPGYRFNSQNVDIPVYYQTEAPEAQKPEEVQKPEEIPELVNFPFRTLTINNVPVQAQQQQETSTQSTVEDKGPVTFEEKVRESAKPWASVRVQEPTKIWPASIWEPAKTQENDEAPISFNIQRYQQVKIPADGEPLPIEREEKPKTTTQAPPPSIIQRQYSSLLAPLVQLEKITESIAKEKEELINSEKDIHNKLKELKESDNHDEEKYAIELDKLNRNLVKQNILAQKFAQEISKKSQSDILANSEATDEKRKSEELLKQVRKPEPTPVLVSIPRPTEVSSTPKPYTTPSDVEEKKPVPIPGTRNVYVQVDNPYIVQKVVPVQVNHDFPVKYALRQPDELVLRPLWEHK